MIATILDLSHLSLLLRDGSPEAGEDLAQREARVPVELGRLPPRHGGGNRGVFASITKPIPSLSVVSTHSLLIFILSFRVLTLFHI